MSTPTALVQKLWNYCYILQDDGLSYGDYVEPLTFLLFLNMPDEQSRPPFDSPSLSSDGTGKPNAVPEEFAWPRPLTHSGCRLTALEELESVVSANLQSATRIRQSICQKAFTGGLLKIDAVYK